MGIKAQVDWVPDSGKDTGERVLSRGRGEKAGAQGGRRTQHVSADMEGRVLHSGDAASKVGAGIVSARGIGGDSTCGPKDAGGQTEQWKHGCSAPGCD